MTAERTARTLADLLQAAQHILFTLPADPELGPGHAISARGRPPSYDLHRSPNIPG